MIKYILIVSLIAALVPTAMTSVSASSDSEIALFSRASTNVIPSTQQQAQGEFPRYENPTLGISVQHPSDWLLVGESDDKLNFLKDVLQLK